MSGDVNPIHLHALTARAMGFPRAIAHGMWTYARTLAPLGPGSAAAGSSTCGSASRSCCPAPASWRVDVARLAVLVRRKGSGEHLVTTVTPA